MRASPEVSVKGRSGESHSDPSLGSDLKVNGVTPAS